MINNLIKNLHFIDGGGSISGKIVLLRGDCNVPMESGMIMDDSRLLALLPTIHLLLQHGNKIILASHLGRPKGIDAKLSMQVIADFYAKILANVGFCKEFSDVQARLTANDVVVIENLRFYDGEKSNSDDFSAILADLADVYVNDAFACSHREHASIVGVTSMLPSYGGLLMRNELVAISELMDHELKPSVAIIGGGKIDTKIDLVANLAKTVDHVILGGRVANFFSSNYESMHNLYKNTPGLHGLFEKIMLPEDFVVELSENVTQEVKQKYGILDTAGAMDIGGKTVENIVRLMHSARVVLWNGPLGYFEKKPYDRGSIAVAKEIAILTEKKKIRSIVGGGDTIRLLKENNLLSSFSHVSTGGGALLDLLSGNDLPGLMALERNSLEHYK